VFIFLSNIFIVYFTIFSPSFIILLSNNLVIIADYLLVDIIFTYTLTAYNTHTVSTAILLAFLLNTITTAWQILNQLFN